MKATQTSRDDSGKVKLLIPESRPFLKWETPPYRQSPVRYSYPFFRRHGVYLHRIRSAINHYSGTSHQYTTYRLRCGGVKRGGPENLLPCVPVAGVVCATCEGRAVGAGVLKTHKIQGRIVRFSPCAEFHPDTKSYPKKKAGPNGRVYELRKNRKATK